MHELFGRVQPQYSHVNLLVSPTTVLEAHESTPVLDRILNMAYPKHTRRFKENLRGRYDTDSPFLRVVT